MKNNNLKSKLTLSLLIIFQLLNPILSNCGKNCFSCSKSGKDCLQCYHSQTRDGGCLTTPRDKKCLISTKRSPKNCDICISPYANQYDNPESECTKINPRIQDCIAYQIKFGEVICKLCNNGFPSPNGEKCIRFDEVKSEISIKMVKNCLIGGDYFGKFSCFSCKQGYVVSWRTGSCIQSRVEGCLVYSRGKCVSCDFMKGYHHDGKKCVQIPPEKESGLIIF